MMGDFDRPLWRSLVVNRFVVVLGAIALTIVGWNAYVASHSGGRVTGRVTDTAGESVAGASVTLWVLNFTTYVEKARGVTDADGRFLIINRDSHNIQLAAEKPGVGRSRRVPLRLYFRAQNVEMPDPLVLVRTSQSGP